MNIFCGVACIAYLIIATWNILPKFKSYQIFFILFFYFYNPFLLNDILILFSYYFPHYLYFLVRSQFLSFLLFKFLFMRIPKNICAYVCIYILLIEWCSSLRTLKGVVTFYFRTANICSFFIHLHSLLLTFSAIY